MNKVESFTLEDEAAADEYLDAVLANPKYRSINEIEKRAHDYIKDPRVKSRFIRRAKELLKSYG